MVYVESDNINVGEDQSFAMESKTVKLKAISGLISEMKDKSLKMKYVSFDLMSILLILLVIEIFTGIKFEEKREDYF